MLIDISDQLTDKAFLELKKGQLLRFQTAEMRIVKINRKSKKCWAEKTRTYTEDEINKLQGLVSNDK